MPRSSQASSQDALWFLWGVDEDLGGRQEGGAPGTR